MKWLKFGLGELGVLIIAAGVGALWGLFCKSVEMAKIGSFICGGIIGCIGTCVMIELFLRD